LNGDPAGLVTINWYAPQNLTNHSGFADLQNHVKFSVGSGYYGANFARQLPPPNQQYGSMQVGIGCGIPHGTASLYIADETGHTSNVVCVTW
jgi:hypothetical protein